MFAGAGAGVPYLLVLECLITSHGGQTKQAVPLPMNSYITICLLQINPPPNNLYFPQ